MQGDVKMLQKYKNFIDELMQFNYDKHSWDKFVSEYLSVDAKAECSMLIQSVCGPYSIPEYAVLNPDAIPVIMYSETEKGFKIQYEKSTTPVFMYELELWFESIQLSWENVKDGTDEQLEHVARELVCHAVNSYFTGYKYDPYAEVI